MSCRARAHARLMLCSARFCTRTRVIFALCSRAWTASYRTSGKLVSIHHPNRAGTKIGFPASTQQQPIPLCGWGGRVISLKWAPAIPPAFSPALCVTVGLPGASPQLTLIREAAWRAFQIWNCCAPRCRTSVCKCSIRLIGATCYSSIQAMS